MSTQNRIKRNQNKQTTLSSVRSDGLGSPGREHGDHRGGAGAALRDRDHGEGEAAAESGGESRPVAVQHPEADACLWPGVRQQPGTHQVGAGGAAEGLQQVSPQVHGEGDGGGTAEDSLGLLGAQRHAQAEALHLHTGRGDPRQARAHQERGVATLRHTPLLPTLQQGQKGAN